MIKTIYIKDFAIIDELSIDFDKGFSVFTGETGAGKSIIIGAINLLCASRSDTSLIRKGAKKAIIEGVFSLNDTIKNFLDEKEIEYEDDLIVYRTISESHNTIKVNNQTVTLSFLNALMSNVVDIHSQKDSGILLKANNHLLLLDESIDDKDIYKDVKDAYNALNKAKNDYETFLNQNDSLEDIDYFKYQIEEIDKVHLDVIEEKELLAFENKYKSAAKYLDKLNYALDAYNADDSIKERLYNVTKTLESNDDKMNEVLMQINNAYYELEDAFSALENIRSSFDISDEEVNQTEARLYEINKIKRKYHKDIEEILEYKEELQKRILAYDNRQDLILKYENEINKLHQDYLNKALKLSEIRKARALSLEKEIIKEVSDLELKHFEFKIDIKKDKETSKGIDNVEYLISTNKGEDLKPLIKVASGGEMSRILLALKVVFLRNSDVSLMIFDEIDTGVSGKAATAIGLKMAKLARNTQVFAITHLAQVASFADTHYYVSKNENNERITSSINELDEDKRIKELAIMSLSDTNDTALKVAKELLDKAKLLKNE